jgi:hypothetical protein
MSRRKKPLPERHWNVHFLDPRLWDGVGLKANWKHGDVLYVLQEGDEGPVKVGIASDPWKRLRTHQCSNARPLALKYIFWGPRGSCIAAERVVLKHFDDKRRGEWIFASLEEVVRVIADKAMSKMP